MLKENQVYLEVWGDFAIFTRPEFKVERFSYKTITPSAARNLLQSIYWHPQFQFEINKIIVFNEIRTASITRNELENGKIPTKSALCVMKAVHNNEDAKSLAIPDSTVRQQRSSIFLADVHYGIVATIKRDKRALKHKINNDESEQ